MQEGEASRVMCIIKSGRARVYKKYQDTKIIIAHIGAGDVCGELSLLDSRPRSASVEALTDLTVIMVGEGKGSSQMTQLPDWAQAMMRTLANRIREADNQILGLRSIAEFQKKTQRVDLFSRTLYMESHRILSLIHVLLRDCTQQKEALSPHEFRLRVMEMVGPQLVNFTRVWSFLCEVGIVSYGDAERKQTPPVHLDEAKYQALFLRLNIEIQSGRFLMLQSAATAILTQIMRITTETNTKREFSKEEIMRISKGVQMPEILYREGVQELNRNALVEAQSDLGVFSCDLNEVSKMLPLQELIRRLDEASPQVDQADQTLKAA